MEVKSKKIQKKHKFEESFFYFREFMIHLHQENSLTQSFCRNLKLNQMSLF